MNELVSIIVPIYNSEKYLERCINSLINQTYKNIEIILIDDGSKDSSLSIIEKYAKQDCRIVYISKENSGVSSSRNDGIKIAKGKYISFVDSDDYIESNMIEDMYKALVEQNVDIVRCSVKENNENISTIFANKKVDLKNNINSILYSYLTPKNNIPGYCWTLLIKKEKIEFFDTNLKYMEDTDFLIRVLLKCDYIYFLDKYLYNYVYNKDSMTKSMKNIDKVISNIKYVSNKLKNKLKEYDLLTKDLECSMNSSYIYLIVSELKLLKCLKIKDIKNKTKQIFDDVFYNELLINSNMELYTVKMKIIYYLIKMKLYSIVSILLKIS